MHVEIHQADGPDETAHVIELEMDQPPRVGDAIVLSPSVEGMNGYRVLDVVWVFDTFNNTLDRVMVDVLPIKDNAPPRTL